MCVCVWVICECLHGKYLVLCAARGGPPPSWAGLVLLYMVHDIVCQAYLNYLPYLTQFGTVSFPIYAYDDPQKKHHDLHSKDRCLDLRRELFERYGGWQVDLKSSKITWWTSLQGVPEAVSRFLVRLTRHFGDDARRAFQVIDGPLGLR